MRNIFILSNYIEKAKIIHDGKYDYSKCVVPNTKIKGIIICPHHGEFTQSLGNHIQGKGCRECGSITRGLKRALTHDEFILRSSERHNNFYDYSLAKYTRIFNKVVIICPKHGKFRQSAKRHMDGGGCKLCAIEKNADVHRKEFRPFDEALQFARSLKLSGNNEWQKYASSGNRPHDIPACPERTYKDSGWYSWGDWLGTGNLGKKDRNYNQIEKTRKSSSDITIAKKEDIIYRHFEEARDFAISLKLKSQSDWNIFKKSVDMPRDIPSSPDYTYKNIGWISWGDWLGTGKIANQNRIFIPFNEGKDFARSLNLKGQKEWEIFVKSGKKPDGIPSDPRGAYGDEWTYWGDWLGTGNVAPSNKKFRSFNKAKEFIISLNFYNMEEWKIYCKSGKKPDDIPSNPDKIYKNEWISFGDWLGTGRSKKKFPPYDEAREFVIRLNLRNTKEWEEYCKSDKRPNNIPSDPGRVYKGKGWISINHWLDNEWDWVSPSVFKKIILKFNIKSVNEYKRIRLKLLESNPDLKLPSDPKSVYSDYIYKTNIIF